MDNANSENYEKEQTEKRDQEKSAKCRTIKHQCKSMNNVIKQLENSLLESHQNDRQLLMSVNLDNIKSQKLKTQLEEARKENKQLLNIIQQRCNDTDSSRSASQFDLNPTYSVSIVHLQYKYEELLTSHEGLLKVLESRIKEIQKCYEENDALRDNVKSLNFQLIEYEKCIQKLCNKYVAVKEKKDVKIKKLRIERKTLKIVHEQLIHLLHKQTMEKDAILVNELQYTEEPYKALLLQEARRTNELQHKNAKLSHEVAYLRSKLSATSV